MPVRNLWVFGYGSLMWNPGFDYAEAIPARLFGFHRRLCLWSIKYRGTHSNPGLVLGLAPRGSCRGMGFRLHDNDIAGAVDYLFDRELVSDAYHPVLKPLYLENGEVVTALTFVSKIDHPQFAPHMDLESIVGIIRNARGPRGTNSEYVLNTAAHLDELGIRDTEIHRVAKAL